jgi:hypothetical protein
MKVFLMERKKKNVLNDKKIGSYDKQDTYKVFLGLQQDYVALSKKKEDYIKKVDKITEDNAKVIEEQSKLEEHYG